MPAQPDPDHNAERLHSLDALRGFVIATMLVVNMTWNAHVLPAWLFHVPWNDPAQGATLADLVFPWFVFVAGCAVPLSRRSGRGRGRTAGELLRVAAGRSAKLYLLGVLLTVASFADQRPLAWADLLSWNILQLLGAAYLVMVVVQMAPVRWRLLFVVGALALKWATLAIPYETVATLVTLRPAEGAPVGPGTWAHFDGIKQLLHLEFVSPASSWALLVGWFGMAQQYLPLAAIGVVGSLATERLNTDRSLVSLRRLAGVGLGLVSLGYLLQAGYDPAGGGLLGNATIPFSKWLFSPAYCLLASGTGVLLLVGFHVVFDRWRWCKPLRPLEALGKNALAVYVGAELSFKLVFARWLLPVPASGDEGGPSAPIASAIQAWVEAITGSSTLAALGWALLWLVGWLLVAVRLDARKLYWRV